MANPDSVPAGKYGKAALESLGVWSSVEKQVARAENVRAALALVSRGEAPFGIVYSTDALADKGVRIVDTFPAATPSAYRVSGGAPWREQVALRRKPFLDYLRSAQRARRVGEARLRGCPVARMFTLTPGRGGDPRAEPARRCRQRRRAACRLPILVALLLARFEFPGKTLVDALVHLPLVLPPVVVGFALLVLLGKRGPIGSVLDQCFGIVLRVPLDRRGGRLGVDGLSADGARDPIVDRGHRPRLEVAARTLGGSRLWVFASITLPLALPGIITGTLLSFARGLGEFGATITFVSNIPGETQTLPLAIYTFTQVPGGDAQALRLSHDRRGPVDRGTRRIGVAHAPRGPCAAR